MKKYVWTEILYNFTINKKRLYFTIFLLHLLLYFFHFPQSHTLCARFAVMCVLKYKNAVVAGGWCVVYDDGIGWLNRMQPLPDRNRLCAYMCVCFEAVRLSTDDWTDSWVCLLLVVYNNKKTMELLCLRESLGGKTRRCGVDDNMCAFVGILVAYSLGNWHSIIHTSSICPSSLQPWADPPRADRSRVCDLSSTFPTSLGLPSSPGSVRCSRHGDAPKCPWRTGRPNDPAKRKYRTAPRIREWCTQWTRVRRTKQAQPESWSTIG